MLFPNKPIFAAKVTCIFKINTTIYPQVMRSLFSLIESQGSSRKPTQLLGKFRMNCVTIGAVMFSYMRTNDCLCLMTVITYENM